jgi:hypothetical protein
MKLPVLNRKVMVMLVAGLVLGHGIAKASAGERSGFLISLEHPPGSLKMGDTPNFLGAVTNLGSQPAQGLVVYLSLVSLTPGQEHPVDLEDWSAQKAVRIDRLNPGATDYRQWGMRLIAAGKYGVALTVVDPRESRPIVSDLVTFEVRPKPTLIAGRVLPVAVGVPPFILGLWGGLLVYRSRCRRHPQLGGLSADETPGPGCCKGTRPF